MTDEQVTQEGQEAAGKAQEDTASEVVTKSDIKGILDKLTALEAKIAESAESETVAPDQGEVDKLYAELYGKSETATGETEDPTVKELRAMRKDVAELKQLQSEGYRAQKRTELDGEFAKKYPEWNEWHDDLWKFAAKHPSLSGDEVFMLVKIQKQGVESLTPKETKAAQSAASAAQRAQRASSEKPTTGVQGKTQESSDWDEMLKDEWGKLPEKPVFK